jgi:hypothetical protein
VIHREHTRPFPSQQWPEPSFSFDQRQCPEILTVQEQQIERYEDAFPAPEQQVIEHRSGGIINTGDLAA